MGYTIYKHISPSNKAYIGITSQQPNKRWQNGYGNHICTYNDVYEIDKKNFSYANVIKCLFHKISHANGFIFKFKEMEETNDK